MTKSKCGLCLEKEGLIDCNTLCYEHKKELFSESIGVSNVERIQSKAVSKKWSKKA